MPDGTIRSVISLTEADVLAANFAALGIANVAQTSTPDRVLSAFREFIEQHKRTPTANEISKAIGMSPTTVRAACRGLTEAGRMLRFRAATGQWAYVPKVTP